MSKRGENIRKRKDGRWDSRFIKGREADDSADYQLVNGVGYLETKRKLQHAATYQKSETLPEPSRNMSFREVLFLWLVSRQKKLRPQTYAKYSQMIENHMVEGVGSYQTSQINAAAINNYTEDMFRTT